MSQTISEGSSERQPSLVIEIKNEYGLYQLAGDVVTTLKDILERYKIKVPECLTYLFIMDLIIVVNPETLERSVKIIRKDAANFHHWRKGKKPNFFSYLFEEEGRILRVMVKEFGTADVSKVMEHCTVTCMSCDRAVSLCANIRNGNITIGA